MTCTEQLDGAGTKRVLVALSGGVDSAVCAHLLRQRGWHVEGVVIDFSPAHRGTVEAARRCADAMDVPLRVVECHAAFREQVIEYFARSYQAGRTPNPCIVCNPLVKFARTEALADQLGCDAVATGHYASVERAGERYLLKKARFLPRDQSYMLYRLTQRQLSRLALPLCALSKDEVRAAARAAGLPCADAPDSQEICFIPDGDFALYIEKAFGACPPGDFISPDGAPCGRHRGVLHYTVGQRKGLGVALGRPVFIRRIDAATGNIFLGASGDAFFEGVTLSGCVYIPFEALDGPLELDVKIRSQAAPARAAVAPLGDGRAEVRFLQPQRAPAPGQSCVFYDGDTVVGGGFIDEAW